MSQDNDTTPQKPNVAPETQNLAQQAPPNPLPLPLPIDFGGKISRVRREIPNLYFLFNNDTVFEPFTADYTVFHTNYVKQHKKKLAVVEQQLNKLKEGDENYGALLNEKNQLLKFFAEEVPQSLQFIETKFQTVRDKLPEMVEEIQSEKDLMYGFDILTVVTVEFLHVIDLFNRKDEAKGETAWQAFEKSFFPMLNHSIHRNDYMKRFRAWGGKVEENGGMEEAKKNQSIVEECMELFFLILDEVSESFEKMSYAYTLRQMEVKDVVPFMYFIRGKYSYCHAYFYDLAESEFLEYKEIIGEEQLKIALDWMSSEKKAFKESGEKYCQFCKYKFHKVKDLESFVNLLKTLRKIERNGKLLLEASDDALFDFVFECCYNKYEVPFDFETVEAFFEATDEDADTTDEIIRWNGDLEEFIDIFRQMNTPGDFEDAFFSIEVDALAKILDERFIWTQNDLPLGKVQLMRIYDQQYTGAYKHDVQVLMKG